MSPRARLLLALTLGLWLPFLLLAAAMLLAEAAGCRTAGVPCPVAGWDAAPVLDAIIGLGWVVGFLAPLMMVSVLGWAAWWAWRRGG